MFSWRCHDGPKNALDKNIYYVSLTIELFYSAFLVEQATLGVE